MSEVNHLDPYTRFLEQEKFKQNLLDFDNSSKFNKKFNKLKNRLESAKSNMVQGGMMGFFIGGMLGLIIGVYTAMQTKRLLSIPISIVVSGTSFGIIMACGSAIRTDSIEDSPNNLKQFAFEQQFLCWDQIYQFNQRGEMDKADML